MDMCDRVDQLPLTGVVDRIDHDTNVVVKKMSAVCEKAHPNCDEFVSWRAEFPPKES